MMFETFNFSKFYSILGEILALYSTGRIKGINVDCGENMTHTVPIYDSYAIPQTINSVNLAGRDITDYMLKIHPENLS